MRTAEETAALIAILLTDAQVARARISVKTIKVIAQRRQLNASFVVRLQAACEDFGIGLIELDTGGFGAIKARTLEGATVLTPNQAFAELLVNSTKCQDRIKVLYNSIILDLNW